jgi:hypothetical protein
MGVTTVHKESTILKVWDTDWAYLAISREIFVDIIREDKRIESEQKKSHWFPRDDTPVNWAYDKRLPGWFKQW